MISDLFQNSEKPFIYLGKGFTSEGLPLFAEPNEILTTNRRSEVRKILEEIQNRVSKGERAAGWISYEAGDLFLNPKTEEVHCQDPLLWFGIFPKYKILSEKEILELESAYTDLGYSSKIHAEIDPEKYKETILKIQNFLYQGDVYQVNFTFPLEIDFNGSLGKLFFELRKKQPVPYEAWIHTGKQSDIIEKDVLSFSPELFWERISNEIRTVPMKGTRPRGKNPEEDRKFKVELSGSEKDRAENLMITDLLRNDLGMISVPGSVHVSKLFSVEEYPTLFQMTSEIRSKLNSNIQWMDTLSALFPGGSITGAPKKRSVEIIKSLESPRGIYTGGIFYLEPNREISSIAIRTLEFSGSSFGNKKGRMGLGSGITIGSVPELEWEECWSKAKFLNDSQNSFYLFTTMLCRRGRVYFLEDHKDRLKTSAIELGFVWNNKSWEIYIQEIIDKVDAKSSYRVKIILSQNGEFRAEVSELQLGPKTGKILLSKTKMDQDFSLLYHKTSVREVYSEGYKQAISNGYLDMIYTNGECYVTEGSIHSIFIFLKGEWITPSIDQGLLPGIARKYWIRKLKAKEAKISLENLSQASKIILVNSLRGIRRIDGINFE
ncbi:bifunctional chorismate-binding protein/class IV aminotransferase [Leptospira sarikeiensis]|uniref:Bifunctional aminodeoxychorismate synthase component I/aminotransferase n=1 Tax=Leptospira sarikeiensis TaxID=2484943 RepID=A0A4R9K5V6_9LEPT|nr:bifunctional chorismate-binding protein/class IV aminotransferase [Leptospira sarikeiensis]TGL60938.1 bifunctional aminodeoxychorismate synthase component I/aminotransferase [Leptospira sarikeiensis]